MRKLSRTRRILLGIVISAAITFIAASGAFAWYFTAPHHMRITTPLGIDHEDAAFTTSDSLTIRGWYVPPSDSLGPVVILLHGYTGNRTQMIGRARMLREAGIGSLLYDARGCGESDGSLVSMGYYETADLEAAIRFLRSRGVDDIGCIGVSQGGATIALAAERLSGIKCAILESTYDDMDHAIDHRFHHYLGIPSWLGASLMVPIAELRLGCSTGRIAPVDHVGELACPVMIIGGAADTRVWSDDTRRLFAAAREPKSLWFIPGAEHEDLQAFAPAEYQRRVLGFIEGYLRR
jgi:dipeptidyl aminopeptidase/acylaminoacyl peptidase